MFFMSIWTWIKVLQWLVIFWWLRHYCRHTVVSYLNLCAQWRQNSSRVRLPCHFFSEEQKSEKEREITKLFCLSYQKRTETMCLSMVLHFITVMFFKGHFHRQSRKICLIFFFFLSFSSLTLWIFPQNIKHNIGQSISRQRNWQFSSAFKVRMMQHVKNVHLKMWSHNITADSRC